jgi:ribosomal protein S6
MDNSENKVYEISLNIVPTLTDDVVASEYANVKDTITKLGGSFIAEQAPRPINLAYTMNRVIANKNTKFTSAHFCWVKFEAPASAAVDLKKSLDRNENIIRFMIIKTVRENTMAPKKIFRPDGARRTPGSKDEVVEEEMDKAAVDKKIEELTVA